MPSPVRGLELSTLFEPAGQYFTALSIRLESTLLERTLIRLHRLHSVRDLGEELDSFPLRPFAEETEDQACDDDEVDPLLASA